MRVPIKLFSLAVVAAALGGDIAAASDTVYAANFLTGSRQIVAYPVGLPMAAFVVGPQLDVIGGMDFDSTASTLWAVNNTTNSLGTLSLATGTFTPTVGLQGGCCTTAFTINPASGAFLVARGDHVVYSLDPATGSMNALGIGVPQGGSITALAVDCAGVLIAATTIQGSGVLFRSDLQTNPTLIGGAGTGSATSLEFDNRTGKLYGWFNGSGDESSTHGEVSLVDGALSNTSLLMGRYRMAIDNACSLEQLRVFADGFEG